MSELTIGPTHLSDRQDILTIINGAFGGDKEVATLVSDLLGDDSAQPRLSLLARYQGRAVGYVLFTRASITPESESEAAILAPLAVMPEFQNQGIGKALIETGANLLSQRGVDLAFVLGYPDYYTRHGFTPAGRFGLQAPYPIPEIHHDAWMVRELRPGIADQVSGTVQCAQAMDRPEYWRE